MPTTTLMASPWRSNNKPYHTLIHQFIRPTPKSVYQSYNPWIIFAKGKQFSQNASYTKKNMCNYKLKYNKKSTVLYVHHPIMLRTTPGTIYLRALIQHQLEPIYGNINPTAHPNTQNPPCLIINQDVPLPFYAII